MVIEVKVVALLIILAPLLAALVPLRGYSFLGAALIACVGSVFAAWHSLVEPAYSFDLYTWLASETRRWTFSLTIETQRVALLSLLNSVAFILAIYALGFRREVAGRDFSTAALVLLGLQIAGLAASDITFFLSWSVLAFAALWCGEQKDGWGGVRPLDRIGDVLLIAGVVLLLAGFARGAVYCVLLAICNRMGLLPFPLELFNAASGRCRGWFFALLGDLVSPFVALVLFLRYRAQIAAQVEALDICIYIGLATSLAAVLASLKVEDVRRSFSLTAAGQMGLVLAFMGVGAEMAAVFIFALHGIAKALARVAADGMALAAGGKWRRREFGLLRRELPLFSAAFCLASLLLALGPGFAVLWMWDGQQPIWLLGALAVLTFLYSLQSGAVLVRVFSLPRAEKTHAFPAPEQASHIALIGLAALAIAAAVALPHSPLNWLKSTGAASAGLLAPFAFVPLAAGVLGALLSWLVFRGVEEGESALKTNSWEQCLVRGYYLRDLYEVGAAHLLWSLARWSRDVNTALSEVALTKGGSLLVRGAGWSLALLHNGRVRCYGAAALAGVVALLWGMVKE